MRPEHQIATQEAELLPPGYRMTELGPLPEEWEIAALQDVTAFTRKPRKLNLSDFDAIPFIPMELVPDSGVQIVQYELRL